MKKSLFLTCFVMLCTLVFGQNHWTVNDALYENSMSLLANVKIGNEVVANAEIAAFYDDEVRGVGKTDANGKVFLTIHGGDREQITFKLYDGVKEYASNYTVDFVTNGFNTSPVSVDFYEIYWNYEPNYDLHASMTIVGDIHIDGVAQTSDNFELAVFYNDSLRGVARPNNGIVYLYISGYGKESKPFEFRLYDGTRELVADTSDINVTFITNNILGSIDAPLCLNFITTPYVAQVGKVKYQSFANAFNAALENNATITLLENFAIDSETYTVADGKNVTLDMAGKTITVTDNKTANYELFYIYGGMTVEGEGTIELTSANNRGWNAMSAIFHNRGGVLTIENGTYKNLGGTDMAWVVDNSGNWYGDAKTNIKGGTLTSTYTAIRNRMEQNTHGASGKAILNVDGGTIEGTTSAIWAQAASTSTTAPATGEINISGGNVGLINTARSAGAESMTTVTGGEVAAFKGETGELKVKGGTITGKVTIMTAEGVEVPYAITADGLYVAAVAEVNGTNYATLQEAVKVGGTVKVLQNIVLEEPVTVAKEVVVVLNLDGKTINVAYAEGSTTNHIYAFENKGILTIEGNGTINARGIFNHGAMTLTNGTINAIDGNGGYAVRNYEGATFTMTDGTIATTLEDDHKVNNGGYDATTVRVDEGATFVMNGGTINNICDYTFAIDNYGTTTVNAGTIKSVHSTVSTYGTMTIKGGTFTCNGIEGVTAHALVAWDGSATTIKGGTFDGKDNYNGFNIDAVKGATVYIEGGKFLPVHSGSLYGEGTILASGGTFFDEVAEKRCAQSYICVENTDGTYSVVRGLRGAGTEKDPFVIMTIEDLEYFRKSVNVGETKYNAPGVWVALGANIDMANINWERGIGDGINATYDGIFDGKGFAIKNFSMNPEADSDAYVCGGLFGYTYGAATIQNLTLENVAIATTDKGHNVGALVGFANNNGGQLTVKNVTVKGDVKIDAPNVHGVGAIVGYSYRIMGTISGCTVDANAGSYINGYSFVGGITGYSYSNATISGCTVKNIAITGTSKSVGGVAGIVLSGNKVSGCTVTDVTVNGQANVASVVGAIASDGIVVENCTANEPMVGGNYADDKTVQARIGNKYYATIAAAMEVVAEGEVISVANDFAIAESITVPAGKEITLDLNGKTITGTDNTTKNFGLIQNNGTLTVNDATNSGKMTVNATTNSGWNRYSAVISNNPGATLTVNGGTIEHLGGTDMAYGIDALTNGNIGDVNTTINGGTIKSTYRAVRQFLNSDSKENNLTVNGGTLVGANKSIFFHDPSAKANNGKVTVSANAVLNGDVYLFVTAGSTVWPVEVAIADKALNGSEILTANVPAAYAVENIEGIWTKLEAVATVNGVGYSTVTKAIAAAEDGGTVQLLPVTISEEIKPWAGDSQHKLEKSITILGAENFGTTLTGGLFIGYNDGTLRNNTITVKGVNFVGKGVTVANQKNVVIEGNKFSGIEALVSEAHANSGSAILIIGTSNDKSIVATVKNNVIENVTGTSQAGIYMSQVGTVTVEGNSITGTKQNAMTISADAAATINVVNNTLSNWGLGGDGRAVRISGGATVKVNGNVMTNASAPEEFVKITGATPIDASENYWNGNTPLAENMFLSDLATDPVSILKNYYADAAKQNLIELSVSVAMIGDKYYQELSKAVAEVKDGDTIKLIADCAQNVTIAQKAGLSFTIDGQGKTYAGTINIDGNNRGAGLSGAGLTITKVNFKNEVNTPISITTTEYACNITVDGCTFTGKEGVTTYGIKLSHALNITVKNVEATDVFDLVYSSKVVTGFTAENVKATNVEYGFFMSYGKNLSFKNVEVNATMSGVGLNNYNASQATFENCKFTAKWPVYFMAPNSTNKYSLVFNGTENAFTSNVEGEEWLYVEKTSAVITATYNDEELVGVSSMPAKIGKVHYNTLQHAINAVENEGTVTLASDFVLGDDDIILAETENYKTMAHVQGKNITLDMNGKTIDVTYTGGNYLMAVVLVADGAGLTINGNGTINAVGQNADGTAAKNIAYMIWKRGETGYLNIVNGTFHLNTAADSIIYTNGDEIVTIKGGTFILDAVASQTNGFPVIFSTKDNNLRKIVVNGGTFNYDINHQIRPFEVYVSEEKAVKNNGDGTWTIVPAEAYVTELLGEWVNDSGDREHKVGYATLEEAIAAVNNLGKDVTLLKDVTIDELIKIEKEATLDLNGNKVTSTAKKAFEVYADATITNGTIEAANRAVDTRTAVKLTLTDVTLVADKYYSAYGNPQPLTIGGYDHGTVVTLNNVDINAGTAGYGIITFVKTTLTADEKTNVYGYAALYVQDGSEGSEFVFNGSTLTGDLTGNDVEGNSFSTIAIQEDGVNVTMNGGKLISVGDNHTALSIGNVNVPVHENNNVTIDAEITGNILSTVCADENVIRVKAEYADNLNTAGYATSEPEEDGLVTVLGQAVAQVEDALFATLQDAVNAADGKTVEVLANIAQSGTTVVTGTVTIDLNGFTVAYTSANPGEDMITVKGGTLVINDSESDGKITYVNTDATAGNVTVSTISVEPNSTLIVNGGTIENKTVKADGSSIYSYAIDILTNGGLGDVNVTINGGTVYSDYMAIRQFNNGTACKNTLVVTDGYIYGAKRAIQIHMDNNAAYTTISGGKVEGGNYSLCFLTTSENILVKGGEFIGDVWYSGTEGFIKGGTFDRNVTKYCVVNYSAVSQDNGTWVVEQTAGTLTRDLENGWNWFSSYVDIEGSYGFGLLKEALGTSAEQIKEGKTGGQGVFAQYSAISNSWGGNLTATSSKKMYQIKTTAEVQVNIHGDFFGIENYRPILQKGWNYISYPHTETLEVALALQGFNPVDGDIIKTLGSSMTYFEGAGWIVGNLPNMEPGVGYMYRSNAGNKQVSYTTEATRSAAKAYVSEAPEYWTIGTAQYPNNMTMIATLDVEGGDYEVAAFVDGELRGSVRPVYVEELDQYIMVMTILGEEVADITFKYYDFNTEEEYELNNVVVYSDNAVVGSVEEPYALTRGTTGIDEATLSDINIYPNPTTTDREINLQATCDKVEVFNTLGIKVAEYQNVDSIDALETAGTYVIRVTLNGDVKHCRLVVR